MFSLTTKLFTQRFSQLSIQNVRSITSTTPVLKTEVKKATKGTKTKKPAAAKKATPAKPKKKVPTQKELEKPKKMISAYMYYIKEQFAKNKGDGSTPATDAIKIYAKQWIELSESEKEVYHTQRKSALEQHEKDVAAWEAKYKRKPNSWTKFYSQHYEKVEGEGLSHSASEMKRIANLWKQLTPEEKKAYDSK
ncbi:hypothetical protein CANARDRAFT_27376 [[Candida] arabinofermentans NRRL YB-2248]|uniref:HMG box domain-containing protein n=1 Tax=[Candida] arabinofermentans NRRL YB-2248 TaxID=983967 RepID=A0A1E4T5N7_9ASCO|nr:hypothetical protein CANARDRAFT_27376 [[Candida] arabinofermentans NRRL YB-2248]